MTGTPVRLQSRSNVLTAPYIDVAAAVTVPVSRPRIRVMKLGNVLVALTRTPRAGPGTAPVPLTGPTVPPSIPTYQAPASGPVAGASVMSPFGGSSAVTAPRVPASLGAARLIAM